MPPPKTTQRSALSAPPSLRSLDLEAHLRDPRLKQRFVTPMFEIIAPRYDDFTRLFSFGMDARWKRELVDDVARVIATDARVLDLACGTGDLALAIAPLAARGTVTGIDASARMIEGAEARRRAVAADGARVTFRVGDMARLELPDASADVVTAGYALRNTPDFRAALAEIARVLRPGGWLFTLDFYRPEARLWRAAFLAYLSLAGKLVGWRWHGEPVVYGYIARSIDHFVSSRAFSAALEEAGFEVERVRSHLWGGIATHVACRV